MAFSAEDFIIRAGLGLEVEDRVLLGSHLVQGTHGGLLRLNNERYYQSIVWRALTPKYRVVTEREGNSDLVLVDGDQKHFFEMKRWMSAYGEKEVRPINEDIARLDRSTAHAIGMIIFSAHDIGDSEKQMLWLEGRIPRLQKGKRYFACFRNSRRKK